MPHFPYGRRLSRFGSGIRAPKEESLETKPRTREKCGARVCVEVRGRTPQQAASLPWAECGFESVTQRRISSRVTLLVARRDEFDGPAERQFDDRRTFARGR